MTRRIRPALLAAALIAAAVAGIGAVASAAATQAAWSDRAYTSATVTSGTWSVAPSLGCTAMQSGGKAVSGGRCTITAVTYTQWTNGKDVVRDYYISYSMSSGAYPSVVVDLSKWSGDDKAGAWTWGKAVTIGTGQYTPPSGYACSELPVLRADGPSWGTASTFWVRVVMDASTPLATGVTCS